MLKTHIRNEDGTYYGLVRFRTPPLLAKSRSAQIRSCAASSADQSAEEKYNGTDTDNICISGCSSVWLERLIWDQEAAGSSPVTPMDRKGD